MRLARERGLALTGPDGLLKQLTKTVIETALPRDCRPCRVSCSRHGQLGGESGGGGTVPRPSGRA